MNYSKCPMTLCLAMTLAGLHAETPEKPGLPAARIELENFKLTLPIRGGTAAKEILQPELAGFFFRPWFYNNPAGPGVVFSANCGGATTRGSKYPRCELREMTAGGTKQAAWSTNAGSHRMFIRQAITRLPDHKPHVVAGQIHDKDDDVLVIRLEGKKLFLDHNGRDGNILTNNYHPGDIFTVEIVAENGAIRVYYNGSKEAADVYQVSSTGCYFKAGCYTQSNPDKGDKPDAAGEVVIHELRIEHRE